MTHQTTPQITIAPISLDSDLQWLRTLLGDSDVRQQLPHLTTDAVRFVNDMLIAERSQLGLLRAIKLGHDNIGFVAVYDLDDSPFIFYAMLPAYRNHGYMRQAIAMLQTIVNRPLHTLVATDNLASIALLEEAGIHFIQESQH